MSTYFKEVEHLHISLQHILLATNKFAKETVIAKGGFGSVYRGMSEKHGIIAVKRLDRVLGQGDCEFIMEIDLLSQYKHQNIVSLIGFCNEDSERILVYKHESKGSLDKYLASKDLTWIQRLRICLDAASGLKYLHDDVGPDHRIIHCDIKSSNILLDENWKAKISDFGLSKVGPANVERTFIISNACGTHGYVDPEYLRTSIFTQKSDVYSFGVVLFEVLSGKLACVVKYQGEPNALARLGQLHYKKGTLDEIIASNLREQMDSDSLSKFSTIAYRCLKKAGKERPTMSLVVEELEKALISQLQKASNMPTVPSSSLPSSSFSHSTLASPSKSWNQNVFISFRGEDMISKSFVDHLCSAFEDRGIHTYRSDRTTAEGELVTPVVKDIEDSRVALIVFSKNCITSYRFLDEVAYIMECMDERGQIVKPIFYGVDYIDIMREAAVYDGIFSKLEKLNNRTAELLRDLLKRANGLYGWVPKYYANAHDLKCINHIADTVSLGLLPLLSCSHTNLVGLETRKTDLKSLLKIGSGGVRMVGIWGVGGGDKSALLHFLFIRKYVMNLTAAALLKMFVRSPVNMVWKNCKK